MLCKKKKKKKTKWTSLHRKNVTYMITTHAHSCSVIRLSTTFIHLDLWNCNTGCTDIPCRSATERDSKWKRKQLFLPEYTAALLSWAQHREQLSKGEFKMDWDAVPGIFRPWVMVILSETFEDVYRQCVGSWCWRRRRKRRSCAAFM